MTPHKVILLAQPSARFPADAQARLQAVAPDYQILISTERSRIGSNLQQIEVAAGDLPRDLIQQANRLRWLQLWGAGADWVPTMPGLAQRDLVITNASGLHAIPISEHILALLLAFGRDIHGSVQAQNRKEWLRHTSQDVFELAGRTLLLIGVGAIGGRTAQIGHALGLRIVGVRRNPALAHPAVAQMAGPDRLLDFLPQADFVVITAPLTPETRNMMGEAEFRAMKRSAYLINIGRGQTIQEEILVRALQQGWIAGAGLDVFATEPLPPESPLWEMKNVIVTAHYSGETDVYAERAFAIFLENLRRYVAGEPLHNVIDKQLGY